MHASFWLNVSQTAPGRFASVLAWSMLGLFLLQALHSTSWLFSVLLFAGTWLGSSWLLGRRPIPHLNIRNVRKRHFRGGELLGLLFLIACLAFLEIRDPYYFVEDDTHSYLLSVALQGMRAFFDQGILHTWNGYQFMGVPTLSQGYYALLYPPLYFSYAVARYLLGDEYLTIEVLACSHLIGGYLIITAVCRRAGLRASLSVAAAISFLLLGYHLAAARSWFFQNSQFLYMPAVLWLLYSGLKLKRLSWRWITQTIVIIGLFGYSGNTQNWIYGIMLLTLALGLNGMFPKLRAGYLLRAAGAIAIGMAICSPLIMMQSAETADQPRDSQSCSIEDGMTAMFLPPLIFPADPRASCKFAVSTSAFYYFGTVFALAFFISLLALIARAGRMEIRRHERGVVILYIVALFSLVMALGDEAGLWPTLAEIYPFSRLRWAFRWLTPAVMLMSFLGAYTMEAAIQRNYLRRRQGLRLTLLVILLCGMNIWYAKYGFSSWEDKPYPALPKKFERLRADGFTGNGRVLPLGPWRSDQPNYSLSMTQGYATEYRIISSMGYYGVTSVEEGYSPIQFSLILQSASAQQYFREYGIQWVMVTGKPAYGLFSLPDIRQWLEENSTMRLRYGRTTAYRIATSETRPLAYLESDPAVSFPIRIEPNGLTVDTSTLTIERPETFVINFFQRPWIVVEDDAGNRLPTGLDAYRRITVRLDPSFLGRLYLMYRLPWAELFTKALLIALLGSALLMLARIIEKKRPQWS